MKLCFFTITDVCHKYFSEGVGSGILYILHKNCISRYNAMQLYREGLKSDTAEYE